MWYELYSYFSSTTYNLVPTYTYTCILGEDGAVDRGLAHRASYPDSVSSASLHLETDFPAFLHFRIQVGWIKVLKLLSEMELNFQVPYSLTNVNELMTDSKAVVDVLTQYRIHQKRSMFTNLERHKNKSPSLYIINKYGFKIQSDMVTRDLTCRH